MSVLVLFCALDAQTEAAVERGVANLRPEIQAHLAGRQGAARLRSAAAWLLFEEAMARFGVPEPQRDVQFLPSGKPVLRSGAAQFSISHSDSLVVCAVSDCVIGADVQQVRTLREGVAERCCSAQELRWLSRQEDATLGFLRLWTRKESLLKATGQGIGCDLREICCAPDAQTVLGGTPWFFEERRLSGAFACICTPEPEPVLWQACSLE